LPKSICPALGVWLEHKEVTPRFPHKAIVEGIELGSTTFLTKVVRIGQVRAVLVNVRPAAISSSRSQLRPHLSKANVGREQIVWGDAKDLGQEQEFDVGHSAELRFELSQ
jgi:hypothetical protein